MRALVCTSLLVAMGCGVSASESQERYDSQQGYVVDLPDGWTPVLVRGAVQFTPSASKLARHTIGVRAADRPSQIGEGTPATFGAIVATTEKALRGLPRSKLAASSPLEGAELPGARWALTFVPRGLTRSYRREHVILVGAKHVFHVMYTAPATEPVDEAAFRSVVTTLLEEG